MIKDYTVADIQAIVAEAKAAAREAGMKYYTEVLGGQDRYACGFSWVNIWGIKGNTKLGRRMKAAGFRKGYDGAWQIWNPSELNCQNVEAKLTGAYAAANVFKKYGFDKALADSRLD